VLGLVALNLGGPGSLDDVEPFLQRLFSDPEVIQLGWLSFLQKPLARRIARRRAPESRQAYAEIGGRSPIREESTAQVKAIADVLASRGINVRPAVAMAAWHPFADETVAALKAEGVTRLLAVPLYPHYSHTTTGGSLRDLGVAAKAAGLELAALERYPAAPGYLAAVAARIEEAAATLPASEQDSAPVLFSAHGLPESYIRRGDPYLDDIRKTVNLVSQRLGLGPRAQLAFQSRLGPQKWLAPYTEEALDALADAGNRAVIVCPVAFTGEHIETLQELDIVYRKRAESRGIQHYARARTVGCHPAFIGALADLIGAIAKQRGWA
jgi:protoporphyrin/coproporphyrin ferrochelatase